VAQPIVARVDRRTLAMKAETTYGTDVFSGTVLAADIQQVSGITFDVGPQAMDVPFMGGFLGSLGSIPGARMARCGFEQLARGAGAAYSASVKPNVDLPLRGVGMLPTLTSTGGAEKWVYTPRSSAFEAMTIYIMQENAPTIRFTGAFGDCSMSAQVGRPLALRYNFIGIYTTELDTPTLVTKQFTPAPQFPQLLSAAFTWDSYVANFSQMSINLANALDVQEAPSNAAGIGGVFMGGRRPNGTWDPEQVTRAVYDFIAKWEASSTVAISMASNGAQYARWKFTAGKAQIRTRGIGARGQKATYQVGFDLVPTNGDDEFALEFS